MTESNSATPKEGFKLVQFSITLLVGLVIWFLPVPEGVKVEVWRLLAIFVATIAGIILKIMPMGAVPCPAIETQQPLPPDALFNPNFCSPGCPELCLLFATGQNCDYHNYVRIGLLSLPISKPKPGF